MTNLLLIESPGKLRKLSQILGQGWMVKASMGHVRELSNDGEDALGFEMQDNRIDCRYEPRGARGKQVLAELRQAVQHASQVYIATDPDREGETIGWHLQQALRLKDPRRVIYSEITPQAVRAAIAQPRSLNQSLIAAGRARDCLDKLVGYKGSKHVVWKLNNGAKSMGRVQSATLHLVVLREKEIQGFVPQNYWSVWVDYAEGFRAFYRASPSAKVKAVAKRPTASSKPTAPAADAAPDTAAPDDAAETTAAPESDRVTTAEAAERLVAIARSNPHHVLSVEGKTTQQSPPPPFTTSTLQQAAGAKLRFSPDQTMKVAQSLYEAGHITYMRTDSVMLAESFCQTVWDYLQQHDPTNIPPRRTAHKANKGAQEAHEAIRPTDIQRVQVATGNEAKLYDLIWQRTVASQCCPVRLRKTRVVTQSGAAYWEARGQVVEFAGYTRYWNNLNADTQLPTLQPGQVLTLRQAGADPKQTQPPPRYTEPKLVQLMERKGIGRPSTYAATIKTLKDRGYAQLETGKLHPTPLGMDLDEALETLLPDLIQPEFTAQMESALDAIAHGQQDWQVYLSTWHRTYFAPALAQASQKLRVGWSGNRLLTETVSPQTSSPMNLSSMSSPASKAEPNPTSGTTKTAPKATAAKTTATKATATRKTATRKTAAKATVTKAMANPSPPASLPSSPHLTQISCPKCSQPMMKVMSKSEKLSTDHFLKCSAVACGAVMFWNAKIQQYELPYAQRPPNPDAFTEHPCPVCGAWLERYSYTKEGKAKVMLRCSLLENRRGKCQDVAFFEGRDGFWSPKFGILQGVTSTPP